MATARVLTAANTSCLLSKAAAFLPKQSPYSTTSLCFTRRKAASLSLSSSSRSRRSFICTAIYNPEVQIKEEAQPETLDYRLFFVNRSGQKVFLKPCHPITPITRNWKRYWSLEWATPYIIRIQ